jgi:phosphate/sulfate permease
VTLLKEGFDLAMGLVAALSWSFAVFVFGSRLLSPGAGGLLALALLLSSLTALLSGHLRERRLRSLAAGACPRCGAALAPEHRHRRWDPEARAWLSPVTSWECGRCAFSHGEAWPCAACPAVN